MVIVVADVARAFGVNKRTIWRWEASGQIPRAGRVGASPVRRWDAAVIARALADAGLPVPASWGVAVAA